MGYQCSLDMAHTRLLRDAPDVDSWCAVGPGSQQGSNRLHGRRVDFRHSQDRARDEVREIHKLLCLEFPDLKLGLEDTCNCLC